MVKFIFIFLLSFPLGAAAQTSGYQSLQTLFKEADSVFLVYYERPVAGIKNGNGKKINHLPFKDNHPDQSIIKQQIPLDDEKRISLARILLLYQPDEKVERAKCVLPEHAILIKKDNCYSYIELCLASQTYSTSADIPFTETEMETKDWQQLEKFFTWCKKFDEEHRKYSNVNVCLDTFSKNQTAWINDSLGKDGVRLRMALELMDHCDFKGMKWTDLQKYLGKPNFRYEGYGAIRYTYVINEAVHLSLPGALFLEIYIKEGQVLRTIWREVDG